MPLLVIPFLSFVFCAGCSDLDQLLLLLLQVDEDEPSLMAAAAAYSLLLPPGLVW